eukprot:CAMPEP_0114339626 /NCGR_PEP_ID=MMETSP0101-20121206/7849_1 /TAXON_ID=38822 ORGANISM="Pteridomonas danica, Strain PT" /NCGR_SAMPLE_ID=MMETSP0101 /ASSEMBLY_ACC=CAM_ASM_000211 /LENGTH=1907 /DNA_ID=CAMNT_0001472645 /DNA_START=590 /DNA_END=6313 /DNA_ORIENTATION=-
MTKSNENIIINALSSVMNDDNDDSDQLGFGRVREITITCDDDDDELVGAKLMVDGECWEHAHPDEYNVYDFSFWTSAHDGGSSPIEQFALDGQPKLNFPSWHSMSRWSDGEEYLTLLGKLGDMIDFADLEANVQQEDIGQLIGAVGARSGEGFEVCGSPGEVRNDPTMGNLYQVNIGDSNTNNQFLDQEETPGRVYHNSAIWTSVVFKATDQLRQRVAFALSQIFVATAEGVGLTLQIEVWPNFYDIFVRNAFTNYRDILKEVSYSPVMAKMLTFLQSQSYASTGQSPDENYAREFAQLFTIGLYELNDDGSKVVDKDGNFIETYDNNDILNFAKAWTGFDRQSTRGNVEFYQYGNYIDPMQIKSSWRDVYPKKNLYDGFIGDGYPLCTSRPKTQFLKKGAIYRYRGENPLPELIDDDSDMGDDNNKAYVRFNLNQSSSSLFSYLCNATTIPFGNQFYNYDDDNNDDDPINYLKCNFKSQVILSESLVCDGHECDVDTLRMVRMNYTTSNGTSVPVYYEYVQPPCISLPFYENATTISSWGGIQWNSYPLCSNKQSLEATVACCNSNNVGNIYPTCMYAGERMTLNTAQERCEGIGYSLCNFKRITKTDCLEDVTYVWSFRNCSTNVQINSNGQINIVHATDIPQYASQHPLDGDNYFDVTWYNNSYPSDSESTCNEINRCYLADDDTCYCDTEIISSPVFTNTVPTTNIEIKSKLHIGAFDPMFYEEGIYIKCNNSITTNDDNDDNITVYIKNNTYLSKCPISIYDENMRLSSETIFEIKDQTDESEFYLNLESIVQVGNGAYEFRNPPMMMSWLEPTIRDSQYEVDAVIDHFLNHKNTPPFVAYRLIQRLVTSNPSPRYIKVVATAFKTGKYEGYGTGKRGDLAATIAAILLDREARSMTLLNDPSHGQLREPLIKLIHFMRAMEFKQSFGHPELFLNAMDFAQSPYAQPSVFNFFLPEYQPSGPIALANLFSPESQILAAPYIVNFLNGLISMIKWGLTDCYEGFAIIDGSVCSTSKLKTPELYWAGNLSYTPSQHALSTKDIIKELDLLLTGGRLNEKGYEVIEYAYDTVLDGEGYSPYDNLQAAQKLMMMSPEFHSTNMNILKSDEDGNRNDVENNTSTNDIKPYKAVIYLYLDGAMDSFNLIVPHSNCQNQTYEDLYQHYVDIREELALTQDELLTIEVPNNTQPCNTFGIHPTLDILQTLYNEQDGLFFANVGPLIEPIYSKEEYENGAKDIPGNLFAHNIQQLAVHTVYAELQATAKGVLGRIWDLMASSTYGFTTGSYSIAGNTRALDPDTSESYDVIDKNNGVTNLDSSELSSGMIKLMMNNLTNIKSNSIFSETWQTELRSTKKRSQILYDALDGIELEQTWSDDSDGTLGKQLEQVAYLIKANQDTLKNERDAFYVTLGGFDTHSDLGETLETLFDDVNNALTSFVEEMKLQGLWENVTIIEVSEFGRTITSNGLGTDHGWGGNSFILGGSVKGGQILGQYPSDLSENSDLNIGRGRLIPTLSWEAVWNAIGSWLGVEEVDMSTALPHIVNFADDELIYCSQVFNEESGCTTSAPTRVPIIAPTSAPIPSPTSVPIPVPIPAPTSVPIPSPTLVPIPAPIPAPTTTTALPTITPSPTSVPIPSPTLVPIPSPTKVPIPAPTSVPIPAPTSVPTSMPSLSPTTADTVTVGVSFDLTASATPTTTDKTNLLNTIINDLDISSSNVKIFNVTSSILSARKKRRTLLTTYVWTTSFNIIVSLENTGSTSGVEYTSMIETTLTSSNFTDTIESETGAVVDTNTVTGSLTTRSPTVSPSMHPAAVASSPTKSPTSASSNNNNDNGFVNAAALGGIILVTLAVIGGLIMYVRHQRYKNKNNVMNQAEDEVDGKRTSNFIEMNGSYNHVTAATTATGVLSSEL